ncbi:MAG: tRNA lysidine(34) synthetase TilS, partial [Marinirhabdus sp.]
KLKELPNTRALVFQLFQDFGFTDFNAIFELLSAQSGKQVVSKTHRLLKDRETLILTEVPKAENPSPKISIPKGTSQITEPVAITFQNAAGRTLTNAHTFFVDGDLLDFPLTLRKWSEGDWFQPFGMKGKKKLSKFLKDEKLSLAAKENIWLLCSGPTVVWVVGQRGDERFKVMPNTKNILKLTFSP